MHVVKRLLFFRIFLASSHLLLAKSASLIPLEYFAQLPSIKNPVLSPNGMQVASTVTFNGKQVLIIKPYDSLFDKQTKMPAIVGSGDLFFNWYKFANEERLVVNIRATAAVEGRLWNISRGFRWGSFDGCLHHQFLRLRLLQNINKFWLPPFNILTTDSDSKNFYRNGQFARNHGR